MGYHHSDPSRGFGGVKPFSPDFDPHKNILTGGGYRDINVLLRVVHHVCELQFNLQQIIDVKESAAGHGNYERIRLLNGQTQTRMRLQDVDFVNICSSGNFTILYM